MNSTVGNQNKRKAEEAGNGSGNGNDNDHPPSKAKKLMMASESETNTDPMFTSSDELISQAWYHYRSYMTSVEEANENDPENEECNPPDVDELHEIIQMLSPPDDDSGSAVHVNEFMVNNNNEDVTIEVLTTACHNYHNRGVERILSSPSQEQEQEQDEGSIPPSIHTLLPILLSQVYMHLGDDAISSSFEGDCGEDESTIDPIEKHKTSPEYYLSQSLKYFPMNAAALSMLANYKRMNLSASSHDICIMYELAATNAKIIRDLAVSILDSDSSDDGENHDGGDGEGQNQKEEGDDNDETDAINLYKEWVELLLLDGIAGAEFIGEDEEEDGDEGGEHRNHGDEDDNEAETNEAQEEEFSTSSVESTASFMAALLHSALERHDKALDYLSKFDLSHRIHPNVWLAGTDPELRKSVSTSIISGDGNGINGGAQHSHGDLNGAYFEPKAFTGDKGGFLPLHLYKRLCETFSPSAAFWKESDYQNRGYYSFFEDIDVTPSAHPKPRHLIDDLVLNHLLPRAQSVLPNNEKIVGYEFWCHTRPLKANLGHQLHFDTDEALLSQEQQVTHPVISSVLYLTGNKNRDKATAGATIVFNQTPDSKEVASKAWISQARDNRYMIFPGNCLHGVLPCSGSTTTQATTTKNCSSSTSSENVERLTLMVGFWKRRVPDQMKERHLYGPCGPIPEANEEHTWVSEIQKGYENDNGIGNEGSIHQTATEIDSETVINISTEALPSVSPAWEDISSQVELKKDPELDIPSSLDHRFFVKSAPHCFTASLFKNETF